MPNAAALNIVPSIRPPLPKADFAPNDPRAPDFAGLLDASTQPPPKDPSPQPRNDDTRSPPTRRADGVQDDSPSQRPSDKPERASDSSSNGSTNDATTQQRDTAPADPSKAPPEKSAKAGSSSDKADSDKKAPDEKAAEENKAADAIAANIAADAQNVVPTQSVDAAAVLAAAVPTTVAANDGTSIAAPTLSTGVAAVETAASVASVQPTAIVAAPALITAAAAAAEKTDTKAVTPDGVPSDTDTAGVEKFSDVIEKTQPTAPKTPAAAATATNEKTSEKTKTDETQLQAAETDGATQKASGQQVSELTKSLHSGESKTPSVEHAAAAKSDSKPTVETTAVAGNTPSNNQPATTPVTFGAAALSADGTSATAAAPRASTSDTATVPVAGLAVEIATHAKDGNKSFDIRLDPPELGRIHVRLDIDGKGNVTSHLLVDRADTYDLLRRDFSGLERALNDAGLKTGDNSLQFTMRDQGFTGDQQRGNQFTNSSRVVVPGEADVPAGAPRYMLPRLGGVDIRV